MRRFYLQRDEDESGVSGTGKVAEGLEFEDGTVVLKWLSLKSSLSIFENVKHLRDIHGHCGKTKVMWIDSDPLLESS